MSKRNVAFTKPDEPAFLKRIKEQIGYKEGPTVDTKRQNVENTSDDEAGSSRDDELPQIVVLKDGDLTAEQVEIEKKKQEKEEAEKTADLTQRVIFAPKSKKNPTPEEVENKEKSKKDKKKAQTSKLSFNDDDEEEEF